MKQSSYHDQIIIKYLLNDLPDEAEARFEEDYLRDGELFEQVQALEEELIDDYLNGYLSHYEQQRFERHYLAAEPRRAKVEAARKLIHLCSLSARPEIAVPEVRRSSLLSLPTLLQSLIKQPLTLGFGAATALLLLLGGFLAVGTLRLRGELSAALQQRTAQLRQTEEAERKLAAEGRRLSAERDQNIALNRMLEESESRLNLKQEPPKNQTAKDQVVRLALVQLSRDLGKTSTAEIHRDTKFLELQLEIDGQETGPYRVVLQTVDELKVIWDKQDIEPRTARARSLRVRVPADRFRAAGVQDFLFSLSARTAGTDGYEEIQSGYLRVISR